MTRDDVAHLVIRTFALWLGATGLATLGSAPWMMPGPGGLGAIAMIALIFLGVAAVVWFAAPSLTRAMFARPERSHMPKHYPQRFGYLEQSAMSREMDRL